MAKQLEQPDLRPTHEEIAQRAYALFEKSGRQPGHEMENWLEAESQLLAAMKTKVDRRSHSNGPTKPGSRQAAGHRA
jgi:hypothetical protein